MSFSIGLPAAAGLSVPTTVSWALISAFMATSL